MTIQPTYTSVTPDLVRTLRHYVDRSCPGSLWDNREDIVQQILARLHRMSLVEPLRIGPAYLKRAARHGVCDAWRRRAYRATEEICETPGGQLTPEHSIMHQRAIATAERMLASLPEHRREAVTLYLEGRRLSEIADALGCARKRADNLVYRGLTSLRTKMLEQGYGPECLAA